MPHVLHGLHGARCPARADHASRMPQCPQRVSSLMLSHVHLAASRCRYRDIDISRVPGAARGGAARVSILAGPRLCPTWRELRQPRQLYHGDRGPARRAVASDPDADHDQGRRGRTGSVWSRRAVATRICVPSSVVRVDARRVHCVKV